MIKDDEKLIAKIAAGEKITQVEEMTSGYRSEVMRLMAVFADSEMAGAAGLAELINSAPRLKEKVAAARMVTEKLAHAETVLELLEPFGVNPNLYVQSYSWTARLSRHVNLGTRRVNGDKRLNVFHYPLEGWLDAVVFSFVMGAASVLQIDEISKCSYAPLATKMQMIQSQESKHVEWAGVALREIVQSSAEAKQQAQVLINYWYPRVQDTFGRVDSDHIAQYQRYKLRQSTNGQLAQAWQKTIADALTALDLVVPAA